MGTAGKVLSKAILLMAGTVLMTGCAVGNLPPVAVINASTTSGDPPVTVHFDGTGSYDPDGEIVGYRWNFGDGTICPPDCSASPGTEEKPSHTYIIPGAYTATLTVTDDDGAQDRASMTIQATGPRLDRCYSAAIPDSGGLFSIAVPEFCRDQFCTVRVSWEGATLGPANPGLFWPVDLYQHSNGGWIAGPAMTIGGMKTTDGTGINGNGLKEAVVGGGMTSSGNLFTIYDDYAGVENDPYEWTFELDNSHGAAILTNVNVYVCEAEPLEREPVGCYTESIPDSGGLFTIRGPDLCESTFCTVHVSWEGPDFGVAKPGLFWPIDLYQRSDGSWIAGPAMAIAGIKTTDGIGINGNGSSEDVVGGGQTTTGNLFSIHDDYTGIENDRSWWTFELDNSIGAPLTNVNVYVCPGEAASASWDLGLELLYRLLSH